MNKNWKITTLGEVCGFVRGPFGGSLKKSCFKSEGIAVYEQQHAIYDQFEIIRYFIDEEKFNEMQRFEVVPGDLIMSCSGTMGKVSIVPESAQKGIINQALLKLSPNKNLLAKFLKLWMESANFQEQIAKHSQGAAIKNVASVKVLKEINVPLPTLSEQQHIVSILDETFVAIDKAKENAEKNLQNARELFESYLQNVFANPRDGWEVKKLGKVCNFVRGPFGGSLKKSCFKPEGIAVYEQQHAIYDQFEKIRYFIDEEKFNEMKRFEVAPGDLIMSCSGTMGKVAIVPDSVQKGIINQALLKLSPNKNLFVKFLKHWMESANFQEQIAKHSQGAAIKNVASVSVLKEIDILLPTLPEQRSIVDKLDTLFSETKNLEAIYQQKLAALDELKKSVLQKAFNGELAGA